MKRISLVLVFILAVVSFSFSQEAKYQLSSHILDVTQGKPAPHVKIMLSKLEANDQWIRVEEKYTDENGRIADFLKVEMKPQHGVYKLTYFTEPYFTELNQKSFYPFIEVVFEIKDDNHYHVPITLLFGYSTYRGN